MKIFIIAPEASGKTTFLAMLSRYIAHERPYGAILEPNNKMTMQYIDMVQRNLEQNSLASTIQGTPQLLSWTLKLPNAQDSLIEMFDSAGQDLRRILDNLDTPDKLPQNLLAVKQSIDKSDCLMYLLDLQHLYSNKNQLDDIWILRSFIKSPQWQSKRRMIILSKADLNLPAIPEKQWTDTELLKNKICEAIHEDYSFAKELLNAPGVIYCAIAAIHTKTELDNEARPVRIPILKSACIDNVVNILISDIQRQQFEEKSSDDTLGDTLGGIFGGILGGILGGMILGNTLGGMLGGIFGGMILGGILGMKLGLVCLLVWMLCSGLTTWLLGGILGGILAVISGWMLFSVATNPYNSNINALYQLLQKYLTAMQKKQQ